jgi:hypothetical protein
MLQYSVVILNQSNSNSYFGDYDFTSQVKVLPVLLRRYSSMFLLEYQIMSSVGLEKMDGL